MTVVVASKQQILAEPIAALELAIHELARVNPALIDDKDAALLELRAALDTLMKELFGSYRGQDVLF